MISVIIPILNDQRVSASVSRLERLLSSAVMPWEIIAGRMAVAAGMRSSIFIDVHPPTKANNLREGILRSSGDIVVLIDADFPISDGTFWLGLKSAERHDLVMGDRSLKYSTRTGEYPMKRKVLSLLWRVLSRMFMKTGGCDTQFGFKVFRRNAALMWLSQMKSTGLSFEVECITLLRKNDAVICRIPVEWEFHEGSTIKPIYDGFFMLFDLLNTWYESYCAEKRRSIVKASWLKPRKVELNC